MDGNIEEEFSESNIDETEVEFVMRDADSKNLDGKRKRTNESEDPSAASSTKRDGDPPLGFF